MMTPPAITKKTTPAIVPAGISARSRAAPRRVNAITTVSGRRARRRTAVPATKTKNAQLICRSSSATLARLAKATWSDPGFPDTVMCPGFSGVGSLESHATWMTRLMAPAVQELDLHPASERFDDGVVVTRADGAPLLEVLPVCAPSLSYSLAGCCFHHVKSSC